MAYDSTLPDDRNWVRFLIADTDDSAPLFADSEIDEVIAAQIVSSPASRYYAAALLLGRSLSRYALSGQGLLSKTVGRLSKMWGVSGTTHQAITMRIHQLRAEGALLAASPARQFRVMGTARTRII